MADETKDENKEAEKTADAKEQSEELDLAKDKKSSGSMKLIIILAAAFVLLAAVAVTLTIVLMSGGDEEVVASDAATAEAADTVAAEEVAEPEKPKIEVNPNGPAQYYSIRPAFVVHYETKGRMRYLQISVDVMTRSEDVILAVESHMPRIKNDLIELFSSKSYDEINTNDGKQLLRQDALAVVQGVMENEIGIAGVEDVLFTTFVMQ